MTDTDVAAMIRECMIVTIKLGGPPLVIGLVVGLVVSLIQAVTQINEATLAFLPKVVAIGLTMVLLGIRWQISDPYTPHKPLGILYCWSGLEALI